MPFQSEQDALQNDNVTDNLLTETAYAGVDVYEYRHAKMLMHLFCQAESGNLYQLTRIYRNQSPKIIENSGWEASYIPTSNSEVACPNTPLAAIVNYDDPGIPTVHLYYLSRTCSIREITWINGALTSNTDLNITTARNSKLSVVHWKDPGDEKTKNWRLYSQAETGVIEEHSRALLVPRSHSAIPPPTTVGGWVKTADIDFSKTDRDGAPLPGTSLAFVNLYLDKTAIRGYWQCSTGAIREIRWRNQGWELTNWVVDPAARLTPLAAAVIGDRSHPDVVLYQTDAAHRILRTITGSSTTEIIDQENVDECTNLAIINSDSGHYVFATSSSATTQWVAPKNGGDFRDRARIPIVGNSKLFQGKIITVRR